MMTSFSRNVIAPLSLRSCLKLGAVLLGLAPFVPAAQAARVLAATQPFRCATDGLCITATDAAQAGSLQGAYRQAGQEIQFEALYSPWTPPADEPAPWAYSSWCVRLTEPGGEVFSTQYGNPTCLALWYPNWREGISDDEMAERTQRLLNEGPLVLQALPAVQMSTPPVGQEQAWEEVEGLMARFADDVRYHTGL